MKTRLLVVMIVVLACAACARQHVSSYPHDNGRTVVRAVYACDHGPLVLVDGGSHGPFLLDGGLQRVLKNPWHSHEGDHFVTLTNLGDEQRPVAFEYVVPLDLRKSVTVRTYDRSSGALFKVAVMDAAWKVRGEASEEHSCDVSSDAISAERLRHAKLVNVPTLDASHR